MPSSTSSSELERPIPALTWRTAVGVWLTVFLVLATGWETYCRTVEWLRPGLHSSEGLWHVTRDRIDRERGGVAIVGSSRVLFDINLETWREVTGYLPIQLALEGTNPRPFLRHLARDTDFDGLVVVGVTEVLFFPPDLGLRAAVLQRYRDLTPADRASIWLSMHVVEPLVAFYKPDFALFTILERQSWWPHRRDMLPPLPEVRQLSTALPTRHTPMWERVEDDPAYQKVVRDIWLSFLSAPRPEVPPDVMKKHMEQVLAEVRADVAAVRARGGEVIFVRAPSAGPFLEAERKGFPKEHVWSGLLAATDAAGVHFEDHPDLQTFELPEWSHISARQTDAFTRALLPHLRAALAARGTPRPEVGR
jgi:hypothetical protein